MSKTLLLADDSVVIQKLVGLSFANEDVEIVTTDNGDDAVIKAREITPDVILADVVMPGKSGYEVCEAIKQDPALAHIPVLLLTGTFEAFDEARAASAGADGQITKPFEAQSLVERVSEIMNAASTPAAAIPTTPTEAILDASSNDSADFDFFDPTVSTLSADQSNAQLADARPNQDQTPAIDVSDDSLFGAPGDGATDELDTQGGSMALGENVAPGSASPAPREALQLDSLDDRDDLDADQTIVFLPEQVTPLPPSSGDPLATFGADLDAAQETILAAPTPVDLDTDMDAVPADPGATIVAGVDDRNASTTPNYSHDVTAGDTRSELPPVTSFVIQPPTDDEFEDLTIHTPTAAIDQSAAAAPSPRPIENPLYESPGQIDAGATVVADLDLHLADPTPVDSPTAPSPLDLGPSNVSRDELDFAFDVSEQATSSDLNDTLSESFSSLMDISESQILGDSSTPTEGPLDAIDSDSESVVTGFDDAFAAGYDVSASDLATAPHTPPTPSTPQRPTTPDSSSAVEQPMTIQGAVTPNGVLSLKPSEPDLDVELPRQTHGDGGRIPDLSPMIEQRIQETLEKVAWEAFSDLSESIVKQVIGRIEKIAWEVIPEMAETLVREEIRKMKGEND